MTDNGMLMILTTSTLHTLALAVIAAVLVLVMLRLLDIVTGRPFSHTLEKIDDEPIATALYFGLRVLAVCLLVGLAIS